MKEFNFNIRLRLVPDFGNWNEKEYIADQIPESEIKFRNLDGEYDWFENTDIIVDGFDNNIAIMEGKFTHNKFEVHIIYDGDFNNLNYIKEYINGCLSDGIGENQIGYATYNGNPYEVWFGDLETTEPISKQWGNGYFETTII